MSTFLQQTYELSNDVNDNHEQQIGWIINQLAEIKSRSEKARLIGFDKKESQPDMMRTTLNFIEKKVTYSINCTFS